MLFFNVNGAEKQRLFDERITAVCQEQSVLIKTIEITNAFDRQLYNNLLTPFGDYDKHYR
jgi:hypothetical protein